MPTSPTFRWLCNECRCSHFDANDALECCSPGVTEGYGCPVCDEFFEDEAQAIHCCQADEDAGDALTALQVSPIVLEAAGQQRLF